MGTGYFCTPEEKRKYLDIKEDTKMEESIKDERHECPTCKSKGFEVSILGPERCTFCDGTEGGNPPSGVGTGETWDKRATPLITENQESGEEDSEETMKKCAFHRIKNKDGKDLDWCNYRHDYCMIGNNAALPLEKTAVADVCVRGY